MKLWLLRPIERKDKKTDPWEPWYDKAFGFVIAAETEEHARQYAAGDAGGEGADAWKFPWCSTCAELASATTQEEGIVIRDFASA